MPEVQAPVSAAPSSAPVKKKSNSTTVIIIIVVAVVVLGVAGVLVSRWLARRAADKIAGGILGAATGSNVSVNSDTGAVSVSDGNGSIQTGTASWPSTMPSEVPKYTKGKITMSTSSTGSSGKGWSVVIAETNSSDYAAYKTTLESAGWVNTSTASFGADIAAYEKGTYDLALVFDPSSNGVSITVTPKVQ